MKELERLNASQLNLFEKAKQFLNLYWNELELPSSSLSIRLEEIKKEIIKSHTYTHTTEELTYGAKVAWRNSNRCIGRLFWNTLTVFDHRHITDPEEVIEKCFDHIHYATNNGKIRSTISIFAPQRPDGTDPVRILNHQLLRYAGYENKGDQASKAFTSFCQKQGWQGQGTDFDFLPLVVKDEQGRYVMKEIPTSIIPEVNITHPEFDFSSLALKWYGVPIISDMSLEIGGIEYHAAPFNGWYMGTEIGARNLADEERYNQLEPIARLIGLDTTSNRSLWIDRALVELNRAVLFSYDQAGITIVDHHTAAKQFEIFEKNEKQREREVTGNWTWLIPPLSPASTHIYHKPYDNTKKSPNYHYQCPLY